MNLVKKLIALLIFFLALSTLFPSNSAVISNQEIVFGPYTQNVTNESITIVWETSASTTNNSVEYGKNESYGFAKYGDSGYHHEITISPPFTSGHYRVVSDGVTSRDFKFELASHCYEKGHFKAVIFGDSRGAWDNWAHAKEVANAVNAEHPDIVIHGGDMVGDGASPEQWNEWLDFMMPLMQNSTLFAVLGNHEGNDSRYYEIFSLPNNEMWYSFDYGPCHFIVLDNYEPWGYDSAQYRWLENDLSSTSEPFKIVCFHEPIYCNGGHSPRIDVRAVWEPLFEKYGVDMVFQSHNHYYQRIKPPDGIMYIVTGGAGAPLYNPEDGAFVEKSMKAYHYCALDISLSDMEIRCSARYVNGTSFDEFVISHAGAEVKIVKPEKALYLFDKKIMPLPSPIIIGNIKMEAVPFSSYSIKNVTFYIDGEMKFKDSEAPYQWLWNERSIGRHDIMVKAYDANGSMASDEINVVIFNLAKSV